MKKEKSADCNEKLSDIKVFDTICFPRIKDFNSGVYIGYCYNTLIINNNVNSMSKGFLSYMPISSNIILAENISISLMSMISPGLIFRIYVLKNSKIYKEMHKIKEIYNIKVVDSIEDAKMDIAMRESKWESDRATINLLAAGDKDCAKALKYGCGAKKAYKIMKDYHECKKYDYRKPLKNFENFITSRQHNNLSLLESHYATIKYDNTELHITKDKKLFIYKNNKLTFATNLSDILIKILKGLADSSCKGYIHISSILEPSDILYTGYNSISHFILNGSNNTFSMMLDIFNSLALIHEIKIDNRISYNVYYDKLTTKFMECIVIKNDLGGKSLGILRSYSYEEARNIDTELSKIVSEIFN